ncbi:MAG: spore coat U domain-containing protein [Bacteroidota bacterium]
MSLTGRLRRGIAALLVFAVAEAGAVSCSASATSTSFGNYNSLAPVALDGVGNVRVTCGNLVNIFVSYSISLSAGSAGSFAGRRLVNGAQQLNYNLFTDAARSSVWGDGTAGTSTVSDGYLLLLLSDQRNYPVYGRIPAGQNIPPGIYSDTIQVTVNY